MIHEISLAECLEQYAPPARVLNVSSCDDTVFVRICDVDQDHRSEKHTEVAEISVSLPALIEALNLLAVDGEREDLRPVDSTGQAHETRFAGRRLTVAPVAPYSAVAALTDHYRHTPAPGDRNRDSNRSRGHQRTAGDRRARDQRLRHSSPRLSAGAYDYGSEGRRWVTRDMPDLYHTVAVCLSAEDRGKMVLQWRIPAGDASGIIAEFRDRFGEPVLESITEAAAVDEMTRRLNESSGHVIISPP